MEAQRIGILGSSGGVGASTLVLALSGRAAATGLRAAALDGQWWSGGLDVVAGLEDRPGLRWADLRRVRGRMDGEELLAELPAAGGVAVLSVDRARPGPVDLEAVAPVLEAVGPCVDVIVVDLPRWGLPWAEELANLMDDVMVLGGESAVGLSGTAALAPTLETLGGRLWLGQRDGSGTTELGQTVSELSGLPLLGVVPDDPVVRRELAAGALPAAGRGALGAAAASMLTQLRLQVVAA